MVIHNSKVVFCLENGNVLWSLSALSDDYLYGSPVIADLDGASVQDGGALEVVITGEDAYVGVGLVYYIQDNGSLCWRWSNTLYTEFPVYNEAALGDPDGDGWLEIAVVDYSCYAFVLKGTDPLGTGEGVFGPELRRLVPTPRGLLVNLCSSEEVSADFYDGAGRLLESYRGKLNAGENLIRPTAKGLILYKVRIGGEEFTGKMVI